MKKLVVDVSRFIALPVFTGIQNNAIWTGVVKSSRITPYLIRNPEKREEFKNIVKEYEENVLKYRNLYQNAFGAMINSSSRVSNLGKFFNEENGRIEERVEELAQEIRKFLVNCKENTLDMDMFFLELARDYEEIMEKNPHEFDNVNESVKNEIKNFKKSVDEKDICIREIFDHDKNRYICKPFFTRSQEKRFSFGKDNQNKLIKAMQAITGKEEISEEEKQKLLEELCSGIAITDLSEMYAEPSLSGMQYISVFKNYLLKKGYTFEEIEKMSLEEIKTKTLETYNSQGVEIHSSLVAQCVNDSIEYINIDKFLLAAMARPLEAFERISLKEDDDDKISDDLELPKEMSESDSREITQNNSKNEEKVKIDEKDDDAYILQEVNFETIVEKNKRVEEIVRRILSADIIDKKTKIKLLLNYDSKEESLKTIEDLLGNYCDGIYITEVSKLNLLYNAFLNINEMDSWSDELVKRLEYTKNDLFVVGLVNFNNFKRLYSLGKMSKEDVDNILRETKNPEFEDAVRSTFSKGSVDRTELILNNASNLLKNLYTSKIINVEDLKRYFDDDVIGIDDILSLTEDLQEDEKNEYMTSLKNTFEYKTLLEKYKSYIEEEQKYLIFKEKNQGETEKLEEYEKIIERLRNQKERYLSLFKKIYGDLPQEEKNKILETYYFDMETDDENILQESIIEMYNDSIIGLENIINFDSDYIIPMLDKLSLEDAEKIRSSMSLEDLEKMLDPIFLDSDYKYYNISDERKFIIIMNLLGEDTPKDKELREMYLSLLEFNDDEISRRSKNGQRNIMDKKKGNLSKQYTYPDVIKWKFFKSLDKDMRVTRHSNGYVEFASTKFDSRIIEKYYEKDKEVYGYATYILPEATYRKNQQILITKTVNSSILETSELRDITPRKDRIAHRTQSKDKTWMDEILRYFDIDLSKNLDSRYTQEDFEILKRELPILKKQYELLDR